MQFIALIYSDPANRPQPGTAEMVTVLADYRAATNAYKAAHVYVAGEPLLGVETARSLRIRGDQTLTMDGPFAETKEHLGGFYILDCATMADALTWAALIPAARFGTVEVRPLMVMPS